MATRNLNSAKMKLMNEGSVLASINYNEYISRKDLASAIGLTSASITKLVNPLLVEKLIVEERREETTTAGRKPILLTLNKGIAYAVGVNINHKKVSVVLVNLKAEILDSSNEKIDSSWEKERILQVIYNNIEVVLTRNRQYNIVGIGIAAPGPNNHITGELYDLPGFPKFRYIQIKDLIENKFRLPVYLEKDGIAASIAEYWFGKEKYCKNILVISCRYDGIGGGAILNGQVFRGYFMDSCEIGHIQIHPDAPLCSCGNVGCLEQLASGIYFYKNVSDRLGMNSLEPQSRNYEKIIDKVFQEHLNNDDFSTGIFEDAVKYMTIGVKNIISLFSPETVIFGGDMLIKHPEFMSEVIEKVKEFKYPAYISEVRMRETSFGKDMFAIGGAAIVISEVMKRKLSISNK